MVHYIKFYTYESLYKVQEMIESLDSVREWIDTESSFNHFFF